MVEWATLNSSAKTTSIPVEEMDRREEMEGGRKRGRVISHC